jgi:hypothetical protein
LIRARDFIVLFLFDGGDQRMAESSQAQPIALQLASRLPYAIVIGRWLGGAALCRRRFFAFCNG